MSNLQSKSQVFDIATIDEHVYSAMKNSIYPGAADSSIAMVWSYCKARSLDPLQKPVHIVPMSVKDAKTGKYDWRDIVMPGIGLYRIQAQRSGCYAGQSDPEFGDDVTETISGVTVTYPKWCKVTVSKMMNNGIIVEFSAKEFWKENYATSGKDSSSPNAMWKKRPYAQLAKCAEAQALRKAFPDIIDQSPTAEEMEGKTFEDGVVSTQTSRKEIYSAHINNLISEKEESSIDFVALRAQLEDATSIAEMDKIALTIPKKYLQTEEVLSLRKLYKERADFFKANKITGELDILDKNGEITANIDEIPEHDHVVSPIMYEQVKKQLEKAKSRDTLDIAADMIRECPIENHAELNYIYVKRQSDVK